MPISVLLAQLPHTLQAILERDLSAQADMTVTLVDNHVEVLLAAGETGADVAVIAMENGQPPGIVSHLLDEYPSLNIIVVDINDYHGFLYELHPKLLPIGEVTSAQFPSVIRTVAQGQEGR